MADSGLLSKENIVALEERNYEYISGARLKNESERIKKLILDKKLTDGAIAKIKRSSNTRLIINYEATEQLKMNIIEKEDYSDWKSKSSRASSLNQTSTTKATTNT